MRTSENLRASDVHAAFALLARATGLDPMANNVAAIVAEGLCKVLGARVCLIGQVPRDVQTVKMPWRPHAEHGWRDHHQRHTIFASLEDPNAKDPTVLELLGRDGEFRTYARRELVNDEQWYPSRYFTGFRGVAGLDDQAFSIFEALPQRGWMGIIGLHRATEDPPFAASTVTLLELLHRHLAPILWLNQPSAPGMLAHRRPSPQNGDPGKTTPVEPRKLTPAQLRVLPYLLQGHREDKIAELLCRSRHTVHDHVMAIYREYGVHNRVELVLRLRSDGVDVPAAVECPEA